MMRRRAIGPILQEKTKEKPFGTQPRKMSIQEF